METHQNNYQKFTEKINKRTILSLLKISAVWLFFSTIILDNRWFWFLFVVVPLGIFTYSLYKSDIDSSEYLKSKISYIVGWITFATFLFVIFSAIFITAKWWFGLLIVLVQMVLLGAIQEVQVESNLPEDEKKKVIKYVLSLLILMFVLFCIPSLISNSHRNPRDSFSSNYYAVDSYQIYGDGIKNKEHVVPRSWLVTNENYDNDYINVIWASKKANDERKYYPFGNVKKIEANAVHDDNGTLVGYQDKKHFMPTDNYKGDVARITLYMYTTYKNNGLVTENIDVNLMKTWSTQDPVSSVERARNRLIREEYNYSNRFVSMPWLVGFVVK